MLVAKAIRSGCSRWVIPAEKTPLSVSVRPEQVPLVRKAIEEYRDVKQALECKISELNQFLLRWLDRDGSQRTGTPVVICRRCAAAAAKFRRWLHRRDGGGSLGTLRCGTPIKHWKMTPCASRHSGRAGCKRCRKSKDSVGARRRPLRSCSECCCAHEAMYATGVIEALARGKCAPVNLVYREFTRVGGEKVPDDRTMGNLARQLGPEVIEKLHRRVVEIAQGKQDRNGSWKMRVDTTVVETDIHYPTDSTLLGDGVRVLTRIMKSGYRCGWEGRHRCAIAADPQS